MNDLRILLMAKVLAPLSFLSCLVMIPAIIYSYLRDIDNGLTPSLNLVFVLEGISLLGLIWTWWIMTKKWGWFQKKK